MKGSPSYSLISKMVQMLGWSSAEAARASRWKRSMRLGIPGQIFGQELERHKAAERGVFGFVHHPHPAAAQLFQNSIVRDGFPNHFLSLMLPTPRRTVNKRRQKAFDRIMRRPCGKPTHERDEMLR